MVTDAEIYQHMLEVAKAAGFESITAAITAARLNLVDAERYRWLRERYVGFDFDWMPDNDGTNGKQVICFEMTVCMRIGRDIDAAIDAVIKPLEQPAQEPSPDTRTIDMFGESDEN